MRMKVEVLVVDVVETQYLLVKPFLQRADYEERVVSPSCKRRY